jgi:hypothetical protein
LEAASRYGDPETGKPLAGLVALLAGFGAVSGDPRKPAITPLGRWTAGHLAAGLAGPADPGLPAGELIAEAARFGDEAQQDHVARAWLAERGPVQAAREILAAAEGMSPLRRSVAVRLVEALGDDVLPAWREFVSARCVGPYARAVLGGWDRVPKPADADWDWLGAEAAAAALEDKGPDEALTRVWETLPGADLDARLAALQATGHPGAQGTAGFGDDVELPQVRRRMACEGRAGTGDDTARTGLPQPGEGRAGLAADAGGPGRVRGVLRRRRAGPSAW